MASLYKNLKEYASKDVYPFHMPGHKRNKKVLPEDFPVSIDITEITNFDDLHEADGIILEGEKNAANLYGSDMCKFLVGGSTSGILAAILGTTNLNDEILIGRNCHKSVYSAIYINNLKPSYIMPKSKGESDIKAVIDKEDVKAALEKNNNIKCVVIVSPSYEGETSDIKGISNICHNKNIPLIVDAAHGAHLGFGEYFPESPVKQGADIVVMSLHKTLPAMTGTALIHINGNLVNKDKIKKSLGMVMTSSPSYVFMANMDFLIRDLTKNREEYFQKYTNNLEEFY